MKNLAHVFALLLSCCSVILAGEMSGSLTSFGGGPAFASGDSIGTGFNVFFNYGGVVNEYVAMRGGITFYSFSVENKTDLQLPIGRITTDFSGTTFGGGLRLDILGGSFSLANKFLAYGIFGLGLNVGGGRGDFSSSVTIVSRTTTSSGPANSNAEVKAAFRIGAGGGYRISQSVAVIMEIKYEIIDKFKYMPLRIGFSFLP